MNIESEYPQQPAREYLFVLLNGQRHTLSLRGRDSVLEYPDCFVARTHGLAGSETTTFYKSQIISVSVRDFLETVYPPGESPIEKELDRLKKEAEDRHTAQQRFRNFGRNHVKEQQHG